VAPLEPHEEVVNLIGLGFGLAIRDLPDRERVAFPMVGELAVSGIAFLLEGGHFLQSSCNDWRFGVDLSGMRLQHDSTAKQRSIKSCSASAT
jgi:hypothetical protein